MNKIELDHWFVGDNEISASLLSLYVGINFYISNDHIEYKMEVVDSEQKNITLDFYSLSDAIYFAEGTVSKLRTLKDVLLEYKKQLNNECFKTNTNTKKKTKKK